MKDVDGRQPGLRFTGAVSRLSPEDLRQLLNRGNTDDDIVRMQVAATLDLVRAQGDEGVRALTRELDGVAIESARIGREVCDAALASLDPAVRQAMEHLVANLRRVHAAGLPRGWEIESEPGVVVGRRPDPLGRVGIYAPGGRAAYPSSLLMAAIPARVAGVASLAVCSPPGRNGRPSDVVLAAAALAGVDEVFAVGGAQAIAAMALGTAEIARVDRIVGPGNAWVAEAKLQVAGMVGIDAPAGPSELLVIADESADADAIARELLAQAEHDPRACAVAVCIGAEFAALVSSAVRREAPAAGRSKVIREALATRGGVLWVDSLDEAIGIANAFAAEHVLLATRGADEVLSRLRNAGAVILGEGGSVVFADYMTGGNHVLPTGGAGRAFSGLSTGDFVRWTSYQRVSAQGAARMREDTQRLAAAEALPAHVEAARLAGVR